MKKARLKTGTTAVITNVILAAITLILSACGGGGGSAVGVSSQVVSGTAAAGAALVGQVSLKDSSATPQVKSTTIANDGTFAIDVTGMKAPFILQAQGTSGGISHTLHSFAGSTGVANVNPLSDVIVAGAAGVNDPIMAYNNSSPTLLNQIGTNLSATMTTLMTKLQPLLMLYNAQGANPITDHYVVNHQGLDGMLDAVKITVAGGTLSVVNASTSGVIMSGNLASMANIMMNTGNMPTPPAVPAAPAGLVATGGNGQISLSWSASSSATSYNLYYSTSTGVTTTTGTKISGVTSPFVHTGLAGGTTYFYVVTAVNSTGESSASSQATASTTAVQPTPTVPGAPGTVSATGGTKQVTVTWTAVTGATSYNIYWSTTSGVTTANGTKITNVTSPAVHNALADSTTYYYIVTAVNAVGESAASAQAQATTLAAVPAPTKPSAPTGVGAVGGTNQVTITWGAVTGATSYNLYWATTTGVTTASGTKITGVTSPYLHTGLAAGTNYYYVVTAVNGAGESTASTQVSAATALPALDGAALYTNNCDGCHGPLASSSKRKRTAAQIQNAINADIGGMGFLSTLSAAEVQAIATALNF